MGVQASLNKDDIFTFIIFECLTVWHLLRLGLSSSPPPLPPPLSLPAYLLLLLSCPHTLSPLLSQSISSPLFPPSLSIYVFISFLSKENKRKSYQDSDDCRVPSTSGSSERGTSVCCVLYSAPVFSLPVHNYNSSYISAPWIHSF